MEKKNRQILNPVHDNEGSDNEAGENPDDIEIFINRLAIQRKLLDKFVDSEEVRKSRTVKEKKLSNK
ncbi:MAG: hypothetical protein HOO86_00945 [Bacteroidales bacterium]|nr:hypothetical protein [Bacteroidales bacterium]